METKQYKCFWNLFPKIGLFVSFTISQTIIIRIITILLLCNSSYCVQGVQSINILWEGLSIGVKKMNANVS